MTQLPEYSGFWRRFWAGAIDAIVLANASLMIDFLVLFPFELTVLAKFIISLLYFGVMESSGLQATCGMMLLKIKITDDTGNKINFWRACGRELACLISALTLGIGYIMIAFTKKKQALHDMIAETVVIRDI